MDAQQIRQLKPKLTEFLARFDDCFARRDTREHLPVYVEGQLSDLQRKSIEPIALRAKVKVQQKSGKLETCRHEKCCSRTSD
jgi:SRSO17 transposase